MKRRRDRMARIAQISDQLWRLETMRRAQIEHALVELAGARQTTLEALAPGAIHPSLPLAQLRNLATRKAELQTALSAQMERTHTQSVRAKQTEKLYVRAESNWRDQHDLAERRQSAENAATTDGGAEVRAR